MYVLLYIAADIMLEIFSSLKEALTYGKVSSKLSHM
jgi:hypothetical protein